jgi:type II secretory pathway component PulF
MFNVRGRAPSRGGGVLVIVLAILLPIFDLNQLVQ